MVHLISAMEANLRDFTTHLVLLDLEEERHSAPSFVHKHVLDAKFSLAKSIYLLTGLLRELAPLATISFLNRANCANVIASRILNYPCIISERVHTSSHFGNSATAAVNKTIVRLTYPLASQVVAVSHGVKDDLIKNYGVPGERIRVIYNPIDVDQIIRKSAQSASFPIIDPYILGIGRLTPNKNFDLLIHAYRASNIDEKLVILGEGDQRTLLERLINQLGLAGRVLLPGYIPNPYPLMKAARLFVCSSNAEGFPNALVEAMALGCPVVSTDCDTGPAEILQSTDAGRCTAVTKAAWGLLAPTNDVGALAQAICLGLEPETQAIYANGGRKRARDFSVEASVDQYWSMLAPFLHSAQSTLSIKRARLSKTKPCGIAR